MSSQTASDRPNKPIIRASIVGRSTYSGLRASTHHAGITLHGSGGRFFVTLRLVRPLLRSRRALLRGRFRDSGSLGRHPVQCRAEPGQRQRKFGTRRHLVTASSSSGHAGSPAAPLARSGERESSDHACAAEHARCERALGICIRARSTSGCERITRSSLHRDAWRPRWRRVCAGSGSDVPLRKRGLTACGDYRAVMFDACRPLGPLFVS